MRFNSGLDPDAQSAATPYGGDFGPVTGFEAAAMQAQEQTLGSTAAVVAQGATAGGPHLSQSEAQEYWKSLGFADGSFIGKEGITKGALDVAADHQTMELRYGRMAEQSGVDKGWHVPTWVPFVGGQTPERVASGILGGAVLDPTNAFLGSAGIASTAGKGLVTRAALAGSEAALYAGGFNLAAEHARPYTGDAAMTADQKLQNVLFGLGTGAMFGALRPGRIPVALGGGDLQLSELSQLENSKAAARQQGVGIEAVTSPKGAVGEFQVMPATAKQYGYNPAFLRDAGYNRMVAGKISDDLAKRFPGDPEAQAIGYNAGPGVAKRWVAAGRDDRVLPAETRAYVNRLRTMRGEAPAPLPEPEPGEVTVDAMPPEEKAAAAKEALQRYAVDAPFSMEAVNAGRAAKPGASFMPDQGQGDQLRAMAQPEAPVAGKVETDPDLAELMEHNQNAVEEAKATAELAGGRPDDLAAKLAETNKAPIGLAELQDLNHDQYHAAVQAAVKCGLAKGVDRTSWEATG